nr:hypothetical protein [uncultured Emticicia sp.]
MKSLLLSIFCLTFITVHSQTTFESESDVSLYLTDNSPFKNKDNGVTISFPDMATRMISNSGNSYFNPDIILISRTRAVLEYQSTTDPDRVAKIIVDCKENFVVDKSDMTMYKSNSFYEEQSLISASQTIFRSDANVLLYLTQKTFKNEDKSSMVTFSDRGGRFRLGNYSYLYLSDKKVPYTKEQIRLGQYRFFNPKVTERSSDYDGGYAKIEYQIENNPSVPMVVFLHGIAPSKYQPTYRLFLTTSLTGKGSYLDPSSYEEISKTSSVKQPSKPVVKKNSVSVKKKS